MSMIRMMVLTIFRLCRGVKALDCVSVTPAKLSLAAQIDSGERLAGVELWKKPRRVQALLTGG